MGETDFNQFMRLRNQLVLAAENFAREEIFFPVVTSTMSKDMDEQLKLSHELLDVLDRTNRKLSASLLRYSVDKPESSYAEVQVFAKKKADEKFQQIYYVKYNFEEFIFLLDVLISVYDKVIANKPICNVL